MSASPPRPADPARSRVIASDPHASGADAPITTQQEFWNSWNSIFIGAQRNQISQRQAQWVEKQLQTLGRRDLDILDVGCGTGWLAERMRPHGRVTGTDLSDAVLAVARQQWPKVQFLAGDFMRLELPERGFDVVVTLEVLSHVADQHAFVERIARLLKPGGRLLLATQNRPVLERSADVAPRAEGQIRQWVDRYELRALLAPQFAIDEMCSICPHGHLGLLRIVNSTKLNALLATVVGQPSLDALKERAWLGHTLLASARLRT